MSIETTLFSTLSGDATVSGLVSSRIYPQIAPDNAAVPYITYQVIAMEPHNLINAAHATERKLVQVNCISNSYAQAKAIAEAVKAAIDPAIGYTQREIDDYFPQTENHRVALDLSLIG